MAVHVVCRRCIYIGRIYSFSIFTHVQMCWKKGSEEESYPRWFSHLNVDGEAACPVIWSEGRTEEVVFRGGTYAPG